MVCTDQLYQYSALSISRGIFYRKYSEKTLHGLSIRPSYEAYFLNSWFEQGSIFLPSVLSSMSTVIYRVYDILQDDVTVTGTIVARNLTKAPNVSEATPTIIDKFITCIPKDLTTTIETTTKPSAYSMGCIVNVRRWFHFREFNVNWILSNLWKYQWHRNQKNLNSS